MIGCGAKRNIAPNYNNYNTDPYFYINQFDLILFKLWALFVPVITASGCSSTTGIRHRQIPSHRQNGIPVSEWRPW